MKSLNQKDATLHATPRDADLPLAPRPGISAAAVNPLFENGVGSMSDAAVDAERKAKAARAKKLLAQRQKAKANAVVSSSIAPSSPSLTINDALTVPLVRTSLSLDDNSREALEEKSTPNDLANRTPGAASPRPPPPPIVPSSPAPSSNQQSPPLDSSSNLRQTVSLLIAERSDLQSQITTLQASLSSARGDSQLLAEGRTLIVQLEGEKRDLESRLGELDERAKKAEEGVAGLGTVRNEVDGLRKERDNLTRQRDGAEEGRKEKEDGERERMKELERAREREGGLEAEVGRLRHTNSELSTNSAKLRSELESLRSSSTASASTLTDLQSAHSALQSTHSTLQTSHSTLQTELTSLQSAHDSLRASSEASTSSHSTLTTTLETTRSELGTSKSNLERTTKRAEAAEKKRAALQRENDELVRQLEEVRGRVVEVMEEKVELAGRVESWEGRGRGWEQVRSELEVKAEEAAALHDQLSSIAQGNRASSEKAEAYDLLQKAYTALQSQLDQLQLQIRSSTSTTPSAIPLPTSPAPSSNTNTDDRLRSLESALHASQTRVHTLSRQLTEMHAAYATSQRERDDALSSSAFSGGTGTKGLFLSPSEEVGSPGNGNGNGNGLGRPPIMGKRSVDMMLPPSVRHRRLVSLSALKARMEPPRPLASPSRLGIEAVSEGDEGEGRMNGSVGLTPTHAPLRKQFGDEIVFCCPACEGDLITL